MGFCRPTWYSIKSGKAIKASTAKKKLGAKKFEAMLSKRKNARAPSKGVGLKMECPKFGQSSRSKDLARARKRNPNWRTKRW